MKVPFKKCPRFMNSVGCAVRTDLHSAVRTAHPTAFLGDDLRHIKLFGFVSAGWSASMVFSLLSNNRLERLPSIWYTRCRWGRGSPFQSLNSYAFTYCLRN